MSARPGNVWKRAGHVQDISGKFTGYVLDICEEVPGIAMTFPIKFRDMFGNCPDIPGKKSGSNPGNFRDMSGQFQEMSGKFPGTKTGMSKKHPGTNPGYFIDRGGYYLEVGVKTIQLGFQYMVGMPEFWPDF